MKLNNLRAAPPNNVKLTGNGRALRDSLNKRAWAKATPDNKSSDPVCNVDEAVSDFDLRHIFKQNRCIQALVKHCAPLHSPDSEQAKGDATSGESKGSETLTFVNRGSFLPSAPILRQMEEPLRSQLSVASANRPPANDNEPDWHPLEAA